MSNITDANGNLIRIESVRIFLVALSPDEILQRIIIWRMLHPETNQALAVLVDAYKEVCVNRLNEALED